MRKLLIGIVALALLFAAYWFAGARTLSGAVAGWFDARVAEGWVAEYGALDTAGFPARFETRLTDVMLADPETGVAWSAPDFTIRARSARPNRFDIDWPREQTIASPFERVAIEAARFDGAVEFVPDTALALRTIEIDLGDVNLRSTAGWAAAFETGHLSARLREGTAATYDMAFEARGVTPSGGLSAMLDPAGLLGGTVDGLTVAARVDLTAPWDRFAVEDARPQIAAIDLSDLRARWGEVELRAAGALTVDPAGVPEGRITLKATNWREMVGLARNAGLIREEFVQTVTRALEVLANLSGPPETLDLPLVFAGGRVSFGPLPLGRAPNLTLR